MKYRVNGGVLGSVVNTTSSAASGVFALPDVSIKRGDNLWPMPATDTYFNYNNILLKGDGSNSSNNSTITDTSTNALTITRSGLVSPGYHSPYSPSGWSNYFDGTSYINSTSISPTLTLGTQDFTLEAWTYFTSFNNGAYGCPIISFGSATASTQFMLRASKTSSSSTSMNWYAVFAGTYYPSGVGTSGTSGGTVYLNRWHHIALVRASGVWTMYIDGVAVTTNTDSRNIATALNSINIGSDTTPSNGYMGGYISNVRFVLGTAVYTSNFTPPTSALSAVTNTKLLSCQSNRFIDNSTSAYPFTVTGTVSIPSHTPFPPASIYNSSTYGGSLYFTGSPGGITFPGTNLAFGTGDFTIEFWLRSYQAATQINLIWMASSWAIICYNTNSSIYWQAVQGVTSVLFAPYNNLFDGNWHHVAAVRQSGAFKLYIDGVVILTGTDTRNYSATNTVTVGKPGSYGYFVGNMSDIRIVVGTALYSGANTSSPNFSLPSSPLTAVSGTQLLIKGNTPGIYDSTAKQVVVTNGTYISTVQSKYGGSSIYFPGGTSSLYATPITTAAASPLNNTAGTLGNGDYTVEMWTYYTGSASPANFQCLATSRWDSTGTDYSGTWWLGTYTGNLKLCVFDGTSNLGQTSMDLPQNQWAHIALVRYNNVIKIYVNGVLGLTTATNSTNYTSSELSFGYDRGESAYPWTGYMDDIRVTRGIARYTAAFTPPTTTFPEQ